MSSVQAAWPNTQPAAARMHVREVALYGVIVLLAGLYLFPFMRVLSGAPDEGLYLYASQRAAEGAIPGRDFVQENAPGAYYWLALFFRLFGTSMLTARIVLFLTGIATAVVVFFLARRAGSNGIFATAFVVITSIPLMPINSPHYDSNLFALLSFAVFLSGTNSMKDGQPKNSLFVIAGLLAGWVSCILQQKGLIFLAAFALTVLILHRRRGIWPTILMGCSYTAVLLAEIVPYAIWGALPDLFFATVKMPLSGYTALNHVTYGYPLWTVWFPAMFAQLRANSSALIATPVVVATTIPFLLLLVLPLLVAILGYVWKRRVFERPLIPFWVAAYAMWLSELHRLDLSHLRNGCILLIVLFFALGERFGGSVLRRTATAVTVGTALLGTSSVAGALSAREPIVTRRGTLFAKRSDPVMEFLLSHTRPGDFVFAYPYSPEYYFLADVRNPTRFNAIVDQRKSPLMAQAVDALETRKPRYAIADTKLLGDGMRKLFPAYRAPAPQDRAIDRYIDMHYHAVLSENGFRVMERNPD